MRFKERIIAGKIVKIPLDLPCGIINGVIQVSGLTDGTVEETRRGRAGESK